MTNQRKYDDPIFYDVRRVWFGLPKKQGGHSAAGYTFNETRSTPVTRFYTKGPYVIVKYGVMVLATLGKGEQDFPLLENTTRVGVVTASTASAPYTIASKLGTTLTNPTIEAGNYLNIIASTNVCSTGSVALFIDYRPFFDNTSKWTPTDSQ